MTHFKTAYCIASDLKIKSKQHLSALGLGVMLRLQVRAEQTASAPANEFDIPSLDFELGSLALAAKLEASVYLGRTLDRRLLEGIQYLGIALSGLQGLARLQLAYAFFDAGLENSALEFLKEYLSERVKKGRTWCGGCGQTRGEDAPMLTCGGCGVTRFCSAEHQKLASKRAYFGGSFNPRHKDECPLLAKWRKVVKDKVSEDSVEWNSFDDDLKTFLRHKAPGPAAPASLAPESTGELAACYGLKSLLT